ncbi:TetR/AcrR family transcriptional regulator [Tunturiibacter empetritectus]|uniref:TetR/AcrR family transcriptional regulator n=1 Tax=Tunturiibacter empetritectus TaxID=3069691 RepID=UPI003D9B5965
MHNKTTDPLIPRTRKLTQQAIVKLMKDKEFDSISVQDSAEAKIGEAPIERAPERTTDPRILRTRKLLQQALVNLMKEKQFDSLSVQDIAEAATINRATFYDHYPDKFALLECTVATRFNELLSKRGVTFNGTCTSALRAIVLGVCDFIASAQLLCSDRPGQMEPHMESAIIAVVRRMLLYGLEQHPSAAPSSPQMIATTTAWAIYGAAKEWAQTPNRPPPATSQTSSSPSSRLSSHSPKLHRPPSQPDPSDRWGAHSRTQ